MTFNDYLTEAKPIVEKVIKKPTSPRNFKSYIKRINSQPVVIMCNENKELIEECKKLNIKYHIIVGTKYLVENNSDKITIKHLFEEHVILVNKKNTIVLVEDNRIVNKLKTFGMEVMDMKTLKEKLNESS
jgi:hypothetical protein